MNHVEQIEKRNVVKDFKSWAENYKQAFVETTHDDAALHLLLPDDCLIFAGPPRVSMAKEDSIYPIGFVNQLSYSETRQVQPVKGIGSRRHIFAATNAPVQGNIGRMLFHGRNLLNALYACAGVPSPVNDSGNAGTFQHTNGSIYWSNVEDDIYRIPFGLGIVYAAPASLAGGNQKTIFAEYLEVCVITGRQSAVQSGQAMLMEQVSFMADRVVAWDYQVYGTTAQTREIIEQPVMSLNTSFGMSY